MRAESVSVHSVRFCHLFQVIASEDWQGTRPDYKVTSDEASFRVDYTPKVEMNVDVDDNETDGWL